MLPASAEKKADAPDKDALIYFQALNLEINCKQVSLQKNEVHKWVESQESLANGPDTKTKY